MAVVVVTDSGSRLCENADCEKWRIRQVPLHILCDGEDYRDGIDAIPADIHSRPKITTAGATRAELGDIYKPGIARQWR